MRYFFIEQDIETLLQRETRQESSLSVQQSLASAWDAGKRSSHTFGVSHSIHGADKVWQHMRCPCT
jgi:hypothetical protein